MTDWQWASAERVSELRGSWRTRFATLRGRLFAEGPLTTPNNMMTRLHSYREKNTLDLCVLGKE